MSQLETSLGKYLLPVKSQNPEAIYGSDNFLYLDIASVSRESKCITAPQSISTENAPSRARQLVQKNDIIISTVRPNLNTVAMVESEYDKAIASTGFCVLRANPDLLDCRYLFHWISSQQIVDYLVSVATGASYPAVSDKIIKGLSFCPPILKEQKRIAAILDKADSLRRKRQQAIQLADDFLRATFIDMFGDPVSNSRGWPEKKISEISVITTGNTPSRAIESNFGCAIEWIKSDNINTPNHFLTLASEYLSETGMTVGRSVPAGSTLMTCIAGSPSCIGNVAMTDRKVAFNQQINAMTPLADLMPEFLYCLLLFSKKRIQASSTNSMKGMISKGVLSEIKLIWPSVNLQRKFVLIFKKIIRLREQMNEAEMASLQNTLNSKLLS